MILNLFAGEIYGRECDGRWNRMIGCRNAVNTLEVFRQVRAALSVIPYSCVDALNVLRVSLRDVAGYKNVCLS